MGIQQCPVAVQLTAAASIDGGRDKNTAKRQLLHTAIHYRIRYRLQTKRILWLFNKDGTKWDNNDNNSTIPAYPVSTS